MDSEIQIAHAIYMEKKAKKYVRLISTISGITAIHAKYVVLVSWVLQKMAFLSLILNRNNDQAKESRHNLQRVDQEARCQFSRIYHVLLRQDSPLERCGRIAFRFKAILTHKI